MFHNIFSPRKLYSLLHKEEKYVTVGQALHDNLILCMGVVCWIIKAVEVTYNSKLYYIHMFCFTMGTSVTGSTFIIAFIRVFPLLSIFIFLIQVILRSIIINKASNFGVIILY